LPSGIACLDFEVADEGFSLVIQNAMPYGMENVVITLVEDNIRCGKASVNPLKEGELINFFIPCDLVRAPQDYKFKGDIVITYTNPITGYNHTKTGELIAKI